MATLLTINTTPLAINPAYREVKWSVSSANPMIRAVKADIYISGVYSSTINGVQLLGTSSQFSFDVRKIMQSDLVSELRTNITTFAVTDAVTSAKTIKIRLFEIVEVAGVFTHTWLPDGAGTNYLESSNVNVVNMATQHQEDLTDWTVEDATKKLLTSSLPNKRIPRGVPFQIGFLSDASEIQALVTKLDENLSSIGSNLALLLPPTTSGKGIIEIPTSIFSDTDIKYIDVSLVNLSIIYRFKIVDGCDDFVLFFQNHLGDFDHFDFGNKVIKKITTKNQRMEKPLPSGFNPEDSGVSTVASKTKTKVEVFTSALSANELIFLEELIKNHTVVYKWDSAGVFLSYVVTAHSTKVSDTDDLINFIKITLQPSNEHIVQNGD